MAYLILLATLPILIIAFYRLQIARYIEDLPTTSIIAAAQGLVEVKAKTLQLDTKQLLVPRLDIPCVWYRYETLDYNEQNRIVDARESIDRFYVADGTGVCAVDPFYAEILPKKSKQIQDGSALYKISWIGVNERIYILGWLRTLHPRPKTDDVLRNHSNLNFDAETVVKRYGHLKKKLDRITRAPYPGIPYVISSHYEYALVRKLKQQAKVWFAGFFAALITMFLIVENWPFL